MKYVLTAVTLIIFFVFIRTAPPTIYPGDSGEIAAAAYTLGIGHPPGYPLLIMAEKIISFIPVGDIAFRMNLLSVILTPFIMIVFFLMVSYTVRKLHVEGVFAAKETVITAVICVFIFSRLFWFEAVHIKGGVYIMEYLLLCSAFYAALKYHFEKKDSYFFAAAYLAGFLPSAHHTAALAMLFILAWILKGTRKKKAGFYAAAAAFFFMSFFTPYLYLYIRAGTAMVRWADISAPYEIVRHIFRSVYFDSASPPFSMAALFFKIRFYITTFLVNYNIIIIFSAYGIYAMWKSLRPMLNWLLIFFVMNFLGIAFFTSNDPSLLYRDTNAVFYLLNDLVMFFMAAYGSAMAVGRFKDKKISIVTAGVICVLPAVFIYLNFNSCDFNRSFIAYDNAENICRTIEPDGIFFEKSDETVFALQYMKVVKHKYAGLKLYDSNGNVLDVSYLRGIRNRSGFTREKQQAFELEASARNPGRVFYLEGIGFPEKHMLNRPYGLLYRLMDVNLGQKNTGSLMQIYSVRDFFNNKRASLTCRDMVARYFTASSLHAALAGDIPRFEFFKSAAFWEAGDYANVYKGAASIYYHVFADGKNCLINLERSVSLEPYDFAVINLIIEIYKELKIWDMAVKWNEYYYKKEWHSGKKQEINLQIDYLRKILEAEK